MIIKEYYQHTLNVLNKINLTYIIGADSLIGLSEKDLFKYSPNLKIYFVKYNFFKILLLSFFLIYKRIIVKPKIENGKLLLKLRYKPTITSKDKTWIKCYLMNENKDYFYFSLGNKITYFLKNDLSISNHTLNGISFKTPQNLNYFVEKYKNELLMDFYKNYNISFNSKDEKKAIKFLFEIKKIIENSSLDYWIEGGTLLGAIREKKLIPWDHDLDMGIINNSENHISNLIKILKKKYYVSVKSFKNTEGNWNLGKYRVIKVYPKKYLFFKEKLCLDIFVYYLGKIPNLEEKVYKYVVWGKNAYHKRIFFDKLQQINFYGKPINVPSNYKEFLKVKYGSDWETPKKRWNVALDDGSIIRN
tara:strand:- start:579 stop:1658 length:1080 start_codon:yes stop_codon:yes gene_type:complete